MWSAVRSGEATQWFVRRAGVARVTTFCCAGGVGVAAVVGAHPLIAAAGLAAALAGGLAGLAARRCGGPGREGPAGLLVVSIVLVGLLAGYLGGSVRVMSMFDGVLAGHVDARMRAELVVTGEVRAHSGWQNAAAEVMRATVRGGGSAAAPHVSVPPGETVLLEIAPPEDTADGLGAADLTLRQGAIIVCEGEIREPQGPSASGFDQRSYLRRQGIEVVLRVEPADARIAGSREGVSGWFDRIRARAQTDLSRGPDPRLDEALQGVVMGDTVGIDPAWLEAFRRSGTAHMLSVSGLHVGSLAVILMGLARLLRASRAVGFILAALAASAMIPFTGGSPPVIRATVMIVIVLAGRWVGRRRDQWQVLALAAIVVLALNPLALFDAGFQLSFGAFAGILALLGPLQRMLHRLPGCIASNLALSAAASLGTAPVSLLVFGRMSLVGVFANLLVVPVLPILTISGLAAVVFGHVWTGFSAFFDTVAAPVMAWTVQVSRLFSAAPLLEKNHVGAVLVGLLAVLLAAPVALALTGRLVGTPLGVRLPWFARSLRWLRVHRPRSSAVGVALAAGVMALAFVTGVFSYAPVARGVQSVTVVVTGEGWPDQMEVRVLDIGQGNAVLVRTPERHALLFDGGDSGCGLGGQLAELGVHRLDVVVISHPHADHFAGLLESVDDVEVGLLVDQVEVLEDEGVGVGPAESDESGEAEDYLELRRRLSEDESCYLFAHTGTVLEVDDVTVEFFAPRRALALTDGPMPWAARGLPPDGEELNGSSLVAVVRYGEAEWLLPGDAEAEVLERYDLPPVDVIVVPHHGSAGAVTTTLLEDLQVRAAAITVGEGNSFGHPHASTLAVLEETVGSVARTDVDGWVCYSTDGEDLTVMTERKGVQ